MAFSLRACVFSSLFFSFTWAQFTHIVTVGAEGSFYEPAMVSVNLNDTVRFIFEGPVHGVIQCAVDNPCVPLPGGFSSGFAGRGDNFSLPAPVWDLQIRNVSHPIWFYCANTKPVSHCASGMVGAINPPSVDAYNQFRDRAKAVTTTALVGPSVVTNAPDAAATNSPLPITTFPTTNTSIPLTFTSQSTQVTVAPPSPTPPPAPDHPPSHKSAIIGGSVGGGVVVVVVVLLAFLMLCRKRRTTKRDSGDFFRYQAETPELGSRSDSSNGVFSPVKAISSPSSSPSAALLRMAQPPQITMQSTTTATPASLAPQRPQRNNSVRAANQHHDNNDSSNGNVGLEDRPSTRDGVPNRNLRPLPPTIDAPTKLDHKTSATSLPGASARDSASTNIHVLAREVAAVLMQAPQNSVRPAPGVGGGEPSSRDSTQGRTESPAPPRYRAA